ncbi:hypothetical protein TNCV_1504951 [Trichonephila clavipes]|uniref:Uncharacterized protein n=1 Tax=Trichonephila clavipes TaxID=2585209 RepID=A0A8X6RNR9_TRICX|nr:hypothetical protein TNCV_1504951 [Trichonephila clavipes]
MESEDSCDEFVETLPSNRSSTNLVTNGTVSISPRLKAEQAVTLKCLCNPPVDRDRRNAHPSVKQKIWMADNICGQYIVHLKKESNKSVFAPEESKTLRMGSRQMATKSVR